MKRSRTWIWVFLAIAFMFVGGNGFSRMEYFCSECATDRYALQVCLPMNRAILTLYSLETPSPFTAMKRAVEPGRCEHRWVYASGKGGLFIKPDGAEPRRKTLTAMNNLGVVNSASTVDAAGGLELIRWTLRTDVPEAVFRELCVGADERPVAFDSEPSFRAWFDEFRKRVR